MKKLLFVFFTALIVFVNGNCQAQNAEQTDSVAKIIWEKLKTEDDSISENISKLKKINKEKLAKAEKYKSKTSMDFEFCVPDSQDEHEDFLAKYQLQCYQTKDSSWIAVLKQLIFDVKKYKVEFSKSNGIKILKYRKGKNLEYLNLNSYFPKEYNLANFSKIDFSDTEVKFSSFGYGPLNFVWNGVTFETSSKLIYCCCDYKCNFQCDSTGKLEEYIIGEKWDGETDGIVYDKNKKPIAKFDIKDGKIKGYSLLNPEYGIAMGFTEYDYIDSPPVSIGSSMQDVIKSISIVPVTKEFKNGKFVATLNTVHDTRYKKHDLFIEFTSQDENSPIETIRIYSKPLTVTLMSEVENETDLCEDAKTIFKALNFNEKEYGKFIRLSICYYDNKNGFNIEMASDKHPEDSFHDHDLTIMFHIYPAGSKYLVVLAAKNMNGNFDNKFWYYENGKLTPTEFTLQNIQNCQYSFRDDGIIYNCKKQDKVYLWNGKEFKKK